MASKQTASKETQAKIEQLAKEKAELLDLTMSRGKLIQARDIADSLRKIFQTSLAYYFAALACLVILKQMLLL